MIKPQVIGIGLNGLVGSRITQLLSNEIDFISLGRNEGIDITDFNSLHKIREYKDSKYVLLLAAKADVDGCELDKFKGDSGEAWKLNVEGPGNIAKIAKEESKKLILFSTDFVYDGEKNKGEFYSEQDSENPINWYGKTKYEGEIRVKESGVGHIILRIAYPFRAKFEGKTDFVRYLISRLGNGEELKMVTDHIISPIYIDDIANAIKIILKNEEVNGIYNLAGKDKLTPFEAAIKIADAFNFEKNLIKETTRKEFFKGRAPRPFNLALSNDKIEKLGINMKGFDECLQMIKSELQ